MKKVFLSASVPDPLRHLRYYQSADVIAIREAVRALVTIVLPKAMLVWGGHPAITPMIRIVAESLNISLNDKVTLYQSKFFIKDFPESNNAFERLEIIEAKHDKENSLASMRSRMLSEHEFYAGVFIGGMEGVEEEFRLFQKLQTQAILIPVATTGGAARILYNDNIDNLPNVLGDAYSYKSLFQKLMPSLE